MVPGQLYTELNFVDHTRANRLKYAQTIISQPELIGELLDIVFMVDDKRSCKAAWILEYVCGEHLEAIIPHLDHFTEQIHRVHLDSAVRPVAKVCEHLAKAVYSKNQNDIQTALTRIHQERIIETCFDWMLKDEKIAPKAYSMLALYLFGQDFEWIHPELVLILERDFQMQSSGFKARARQLLKKMHGV